MAKARIIQNGTGTAAGGGVIPWKWEQAKSTFRDPQFWFVVVLNFVATVPSGESLVPLSIRSHTLAVD
jgi:hypothetical protein